MKKNLFKDLSIKTGFTELELKVLFFVSTVFIVGLFSKYYLFDKNFENKQKFDYSVQDSLLLFSVKREKSTKPEDKSEKKVESERELSDFSTNDKKANYKKPFFSKKDLLNINLAGVKELSQLPGIAEKTAEKIINYREKYGKFKSIEELMNIKGIGKSKFKKIKNLIRL